VTLKEWLLPGIGRGSLKVRPWLRIQPVDATH
jgi:hypothetical protein